MTKQEKLEVIYKEIAENYNLKIINTQVDDD
jgi:hypothetical protein